SITSTSCVVLEVSVDRDRHSFPTRRSSDLVRTRVASSDWCASRKVVSVTPTVPDERIHCANPSGPSSVSFCFDPAGGSPSGTARSEEHTSELQSRENLVCRLLLEKKTTLHM